METIHRWGLKLRWLRSRADVSKPRGKRIYVRIKNKKAYALSKLASMTFSKLAKEVLVEVIQTKSVAEKEIIDVVKEDGDSWMVPIREYLKEGILPKDPQNARKLRIKAPLYRMIEERLYRRSYMSPWLRTLQAFTSVYHPQANGQSSNGETPFSLVYGSEAVIPIEISMETKRVQDFDYKENEKRRREDLDVLEERREMAAIKEAHYKQKLEGYYNKNVKPSTFKPGTYVLRLNSASKAEY
ncbi:hypothetical protein Tco_0914249 [Tanacetum coccineum]